MSLGCDYKQGKHNAPEVVAATMTKARSTLKLPRPSKGGMVNKATKRQWSEEANAELRALVLKHGDEIGKWPTISRELDRGFSRDQCYEHWTKVLNPSIIKNFWTDDMDKLAFEVITQSPCYKLGEKKLLWAKLAEKIGCMGKQLRERWCNYLDPMIRRGPWTNEEERVLLELLIDRKIILKKNRWALASGRLQSQLNVYRPNNDIKNHFNTGIKPRLEPIETYHSSATVMEHLERSRRASPPRRKRSSSVVGNGASKRSRTEDSLENEYNSNGFSTDDAESSEELGDEMLTALDSCFELPSSEESMSTSFRSKTRT